MKFYQKIASTFGYRIVAEHKLNHALEIHLRAVFSRASINCVIDVGANCGQYGQMLRRAGYKGRIISFEPAPAPFTELSRVSSTDSNWLVVPQALGNCEATISLNRASASAFSSFHSPNTYGMKRFSTVIKSVDCDEVEMTSLATYWPRIVAAREQQNIFLKLDTQGYDLEVVLGAADKINSVMAIQAEIAFKPIYEHAPDHIESLARFRDLGFEVSGIYPLTRDKHNKAFIECDCVFVRAS